MAFIQDAPQIENNYKCQIEFYYDSLQYNKNNLTQCLKNFATTSNEVSTIYIFATSSVGKGSSQSYNYALAKKRAYVIQTTLQKTFSNAKFITESANNPEPRAHKAMVYFSMAPSSANSSSVSTSNEAPIYSNLTPAEEHNAKYVSHDYKYNLGIFTGIHIPFDENTMERSLGLNLKVSLPTEIPQNIGFSASSQSDYYVDTSKDFWRMYFYYGAGEQFKLLKVFINPLVGIELKDSNSTLRAKFDGGLNTTIDFQLDDKYALGMYYTITNLGQEIGLILSRDL